MKGIPKATNEECALVYVYAPRMSSKLIQIIIARHCCCRTVDFGAGWWRLSEAFGVAKARNLPGKSPAFVSEF